MIDEIDYQIDGDYIYVSFPKILKDNFKEFFATAAWRPWEGNYYWRINNTTRSKNKLEKWIDKVSENNIIEHLKEQSEQELSDEEMARLEAQLERISDKIRGTIWTSQRKQERTKRLEEIARIIKEKQIQLNAAEAEKERVSLEEHKKQMVLLDEINKHFDFNDVYELYYELRGLVQGLNSNYKQTYKKAKNDFCAVQDKLREYQSQLEEIGYESRGLNILIDANPNRMDRDDPRDMDISLIEEFTKIA